MSLQLRGEEYEPAVGRWISYATLACDRCSAVIDGEAGDVESALILDGWTHDRIGAAGLTWCPACRREAVAA